MAGEMTASTSTGRAGSVVVVVVVVVVSPGTVLLVVVVDVVVVVVVTPGARVVVTTLVGAGQDWVAFIGRRTAGAVFSFAVVVVVAIPGIELTVVVSTCGGSVSNGTSASVSTGAAAGGSLCSHASNLSTMAPIPLLRAHDATFCCSGSFGCART